MYERLAGFRPVNREKYEKGWDRIFTREKIRVDITTKLDSKKVFLTTYRSLAQSPYEAK